MELLKYIRDELRYQVPIYQQIESINAIHRFYQVESLEQVPDHAKIVGNVVLTRDPTTNYRRIYVYNGSDFVLLAN